MTDKKTDLEQWDSELKDDFDSIDDADRNQEVDVESDDINDVELDSDGEPIEFEEDDGAADVETAVTETKKKSKLPLIAASSLVLIAVGYVVVGQTGIVDKKKVGDNQIVNETQDVPGQLNIDINKQQSSKTSVADGEFQLNQGTLKSSPAQSPEMEPAKELRINVESVAQGNVSSSTQDSSLVITTGALTNDGKVDQQSLVALGVTSSQPIQNNGAANTSQQSAASTAVLSNNYVSPNQATSGNVASNNVVTQNLALSVQAAQPVVIQELASSSSSLASVSSSSYSSVQTSISPSLDGSSQIIDYRGRSISSVDRNVVLIGRLRIPNFQIISTSADGTMSIIRVTKTSGDVVKVVFAGEIIIVPDVGAIKIVGIVDGGRLILAGDKWYIDEKMDIGEKKYDEQAKKTVKKRSSSSSSSSSLSLSSQSSSQSSVPSEVKMVIAESRLAATVQKRPESPEATPPVANKAEGWFLSAIYNNKYLIQSPNGQMFNVQTGDSVNELGVVGKISENGELYIGKYIIKPQ